MALNMGVCDLFIYFLILFLFCFLCLFLTQPVALDKRLISQIRGWQFNVRPLEVAVTPKSFDFLRWGSNLHFVGRKTPNTVTEQEEDAAHEHVIRGLDGLRSVVTADARAERLLSTLTPSESLVLASSYKQQVSMIEASLRLTASFFCCLFWFSIPSV